MARRILIWLLSLCLPAGLLAGLGAFSSHFMTRGNSLNSVHARDQVLTLGPGLIIHEWSQGQGDRKEWVELLTTAGPLDLRGWDLGDSSPGDLTFADHPTWQAVTTGTLIIIYNGADPDLILPPTNVDGSDGVGRSARACPGCPESDATDEPDAGEAGPHPGHRRVGEPIEEVLPSGVGARVRPVGHLRSQWLRPERTGGRPLSGCRA